MDIHAKYTVFQLLSEAQELSFKRKPLEIEAQGFDRKMLERMDLLVKEYSHITDEKERAQAIDDLGKREVSVIAEFEFDDKDAYVRHCALLDEVGGLWTQRRLKFSAPIRRMLKQEQHLLQQVVEMSASAFPAVRELLDVPTLPEAKAFYTLIFGDYVKKELGKELFKIGEEVKSALLALARRQEEAGRLKSGLIKLVHDNVCGDGSDVKAFNFLIERCEPLNITTDMLTKDSSWDITVDIQTAEFAYHSKVEEIAVITERLVTLQSEHDKLTKIRRGI